MAWKEYLFRNAMQGVSMCTTFVLHIDGALGGSVLLAAHGGGDGPLRSRSPD